MDHRPVVILDSNVVFDCLLFEDAGCASLTDDLEHGRVRWIATQEMMDEADCVLERGMLDAWTHRHESLRSRRARLVHVAQAPSASLANPRCTDPDDQKFIDLALAWPGSLLVSRDKAVLKLKRKALERGVLILKPGEWPQMLASPSIPKR